MNSNTTTTSSSDEDDEDVMILMIPFPAHSHLNQLLHLSRRLLLHYNIPVHYASTPSHNRQASLRLHGWPDISSADLITFHDLPIPLDHHPPFPILLPLPDPLGFPSHLIHSAVAAAAHLRRHFADLLRRLSSRARKVIVINDSLMGFAAEEASLIPNAESYTFHSVSAFCCFLHSWERMGKPQLITGVNIPADVPSFDGCFSSHFWDFISEQREQLRLNSGFIYNTSRVIEADFIDHLEELQTNNMTERKRHWALGPFNPVEIERKKKHFTIEWLEEHACNSVVYVSFGTTTAMTEEQMREIAVGLRRSCKKFIWVVREADRGGEAEDERRRVNDLPEGFEESVRRENVGLVVRDWAPQLEILAHGAVGGFVTHCGWNSCMESMTMGKPMGAWPMHSDQPRNTVLVTQVLRLGLVVRPWEARHRTATAEMVESGVRRLMEGDEMRRRAADVGRVLRGSVQKGEVSRAELDEFVAHITSQTTKFES